MFTRRSFLASLGLGAVSPMFLPFLRTLEARAAGPGPKRFVIFVEGNGIEPRAFASQATMDRLTELRAGKPLDTRYLYRGYAHDTAQTVENSVLSTASALSPLAGAMGSASLEKRAAVVLGLSSKISGGGHSTNYGALSCSKAPKRPVMASIDAVLSSYQAVRQGSPFDVIRVGVGGKGALNHATCARAKNTPAPLIIDPSKAFDTIFGSVASSNGAKNAAERSRLLDFARADVTKMRSTFGSSSPEAQKLERYLQAIQSMEKRQAELGTISDKLLNTLNQLGLKQEEQALIRAQGEPLKKMRAQVETVTAALIGGLSNTAVIGLGTGNYNWSIGFSSLVAMFPDRKVVGGHDLKHSAEDGKQAFVDIVHAITRTNVSMLADMARTLDQTPDPSGDGTMLENTLILYMSDNGEKHHSNAEEWPILMIGGSKMGFKTDGRTVVYPKVGRDNNRRVSNLFNTLSHAAGTPLNQFGTETNAPKGPLSELWAPVS